MRPMDAGTAAILGALVGSVTTIGAALATGWFQRESARISAKAEHQRQLLESRTQAYSSLKAAAEKLPSHVRVLTWEEHGVPRPLVTDDYVARVEEAHKELSSAVTRIAFTGPKPVRNAAVKIQEVADLICFHVRVLWFIDRQTVPLPEQIEESTRVIASAITALRAGMLDFMSCAHDALQDAMGA